MTEEIKAYVKTVLTLDPPAKERWAPSSRLTQRFRDTIAKPNGQAKEGVGLVFGLAVTSGVS